MPGARILLGKRELAVPKPIEPDEYHEDEVFYVDDDNRVWRYTVMTMENDELKDFILDQEARVQGSWLRVVRFVREGSKIVLEEFTRKDPNVPNNRYEFADIEDTDTALSVVESDCFNNMRHRLRRYLDE